MSDEVRDSKTNQLIYPGFQRGPGLHNASSYQVSAIPYLSGNLTAPAANSAIVAKITFPAVTTWFKIDNLDDKHELRYSFSETGLAKSRIVTGKGYFCNNCAIGSGG